MQTPALGKSEVRTQLLDARRAVAAEVRAVEAEALGKAVSQFVKAQVRTGQTVCGYLPVGSEPGSLSMLDALVDAGIRVLLPVTATDAGTALPLNWAHYAPGEFVEAAFGLLEPTGPRLPPDAIREAKVVIVPALAVDRHGNRLGRGAGFYDRSLPLRDGTALLVAVVRDSELVDELPADPHDVPMTHVVTPQRGVVAF